MDLIEAVVRKLRLTGAPAVLLVPDWPRQSWYRPALVSARQYAHSHSHRRKYGRGRTVSTQLGDMFCSKSSFDPFSLRCKRDGKRLSHQGATFTRGVCVVRKDYWHAGVAVEVLSNALSSRRYGVSAGDRAAAGSGCWLASAGVRGWSQVCQRRLFAAVLDSGAHHRAFPVRR
jgi:hypothetical protein